MHHLAVVVRLTKAKRTEVTAKIDKALESESSKTHSLVLPEPPAAKHDVVVAPKHVANATGIARIVGSFRRSVATVLLGVVLGTALMGCNPSSVETAPQGPPARMEQVARSAPVEDLGPSTAELADAKARIETRAAGAAYLKRTQDAKMIVSVSRIVDRYANRPGFRAARADLGVIEMIVKDLSKYSIGDARLDAFLAIESQLPFGSIRNAQDLYELSTVFGSPSFVQGLDSAKAFADKHRYQPSPLEVEKLGRMTPAERDQLDVLVADLQKAGELELTQLGSVEVLGDLVRITEGKPIHMSVGSIFEFAAPRYELDLTQLLEGARELHDEYGVSLDATRIHLAGLLAAGTPQEQAAMRGLLERAILADRPDDATGLAMTAGSLAKFGPATIDWTRADALIEKLGRKLTVPELHLLLETKELPTSVDEIVPTAVDGFVSMPNEMVYLKDVHVLASLDESGRNMTREELVSTLSEKVEAGTPRSDSNAWYGERFTALHRYMTLGELHKVRLLQAALEAPEMRARIARLIEADLADTSAEVGGVIRFDGKRLQFEGHESERKGNDLQYYLPVGVDIRRALATFHVHGGDTPGGSPEAAGPSGNSQLRSSDFGSAYLGHRDDVVITFLEPGKVNVDFYNGRGVVIDLGDYEIPSGPASPDGGPDPRS